MLKYIKRIIPVSVIVFLISCFPIHVSAAAVPTYKVNTSSKAIALTFDDCIDYASTKDIFDTLSRNGIHATFFVTGAAAEKNPALLREISNAGNQIANHTYSHIRLTWFDYQGVKDELYRADQLITNAIGKSIKPYFRTPYYAYNTTTWLGAGDYGYTRAVMCSINTEDWTWNSASEITSIVLNNAAPGAIVGMHAGDGMNTGAALQGIIDGLKAKGYSMVTVDELYKLQSTAVASGTSYPGMLRAGSSGTAVRQLQQALVNKGYGISVDGAFGPATKSAVMSFQRSQGIEVDGVVGSVTWSRLFGSTSSVTVASSNTASVSVSYPGLLKVGSSGTAVKQLQQALASKGYSLTVDGAFGPATKSAVVSFQRSQGITADGVVGSVTWGRLF